MNDGTNKRQLYLSGILTIVGLLMILLAAYFLIQSMRETLYQNHFDKQYEFLSLKEDGVVDPVQVFHGVKLNTFLKKGNIIFEIKDEQEATWKGVKVNPDTDGMKAFNEVIQYKVMVDKETGKESFIIAMQTNPGAKGSAPVKFRTYSINENGVIKKSDFTNETKSKQETQWIKGLSHETYGYYSNLPYQTGGATSLVVLILLGVASLTGGIFLGRKVLKKEKGEAA
ncbi:hypothetical protein [Rossellomorea sp. KS-H15a]|uniref:hypothetical protein n=1 Tax=Rossellomorea sp. KS-H15a TaxID=2963940 RepID=UPI0020C6342B|nr:hypothetical protein [Rossellomorea sp. KS-H15a]UTE77509.1 hypothetical protein M1J35_01440 [Rossellomorea sp. KS-H15a]